VSFLFGTVFDTRAVGMKRKSSGGKGGGRRAAVAQVVEYRRRMDDYAGIYETALRTVKRWAATGREAGDPCPLDEPGKMPAWWTRHMKHRVPDSILRAAGQGVEAAEAAVVMDLPIHGDGVAVDFLPEGRGVEAELGRLETLSAQLSTRADQPGQTKAYLDSIQRMTSLQRQVREEAEKARRLLPRDEVEQTLHDLHGPIEREMRLLCRTMGEVLGVPVSPEFEKRWAKELDAIFARLQEEVFR
jgi:hypothetical protein